MSGDTISVDTQLYSIPKIIYIPGGNQMSSNIRKCLW
jgi:hypothetical protein